MSEDTLQLMISVAKNSPSSERTNGFFSQKHLQSTIVSQQWRGEPIGISGRAIPASGQGAGSIATLLFIQVTTLCFTLPAPALVIQHDLRRVCSLKAAPRLKGGAGASACGGGQWGRGPGWAPLGGGRGGGGGGSLLGLRLQHLPALLVVLHTPAPMTVSQVLMFRQV